MELRLPSQPSDYKTLIKLSINLYKISFLKVILLSLLLSLIVFIPRLLFITIGEDFFIHHPFSPNIIWLILIDLAALILFIAIVWHMHCVTLSLREPLIIDFFVGIQKVFQVFIASMIQTAIIFAAISINYWIQLLFFQQQFLFSAHFIVIFLTSIFFIMQYILILYILTLFIFVLPIIATENKSILVSIKKSISLVWNHWWRVISLQAIPWLFYILLLVILNRLLGIGIHLYFTHSDSQTIFTTILNIILFAIYIPWVAALLLVQLNDLELRKNIAQKLK